MGLKKIRPDYTHRYRTMRHTLPVIFSFMIGDYIHASYFCDYIAQIIGVKTSTLNNQRKYSISPICSVNLFGEYTGAKTVSTNFKYLPLMRAEK